MPRGRVSGSVSPSCRKWPAEARAAPDPGRSVCARCEPLMRLATRSPARERDLEGDPEIRVSAGAPLQDQADCAPPPLAGRRRSPQLSLLTPANEAAARLATVITDPQFTPNPFRSPSRSSSSDKRTPNRDRTDAGGVARVLNWLIPWAQGASRSISQVSPGRRV
jgi:hypothetical protein